MDGEHEREIEDEREIEGKREWVSDMLVYVHMCVRVRVRVCAMHAGVH